MKGQILDFSIQTNTGYISGDDGKRYTFSGQEWKDSASPFKGMVVDFDTNYNNEAISIFVLRSNTNPVTHHQQIGQKSRVVAIILAFFLGGLGIHKFYLGRIGWGIIYLIFCWTFIPSLIAFIEFIIYLCTSDEDFAKKYG
ncbi:MAG TPA: TM2 domain-containing protein [Acinetobacter sp.]|jgi:TM2 domain-containing membrane protein YozV|nr:TM2 domain-containing protein [Acinetobacter sp.]HQW54041.1 TM2 domain-containing protein [Acinetobacter sp.]HRA92084.1 TM2 domain-containing protein [Acinetobacter sp.]